VCLCAGAWAWQHVQCLWWECLRTEGFHRHRACRNSPRALNSRSCLYVSHQLNDKKRGKVSQEVWRFTLLESGRHSAKSNYSVFICALLMIEAHSWGSQNLGSRFKMYLPLHSGDIHCKKKNIFQSLLGYVLQLIQFFYFKISYLVQCVGCCFFVIICKMIVFSVYEVAL